MELKSKARIRNISFPTDNNLEQRATLLPILNKGKESENSYRKLTIQFGFRNCYWENTGN